MLKYAAFSFIAPQTCVRLFSVKLPCFQRYCNGKRCFARLQQVSLSPMSQKKRFPFLCLKYAACSFTAGKICFGLFAVKLGCFQCYCTGIRLSASLQRVTLILLDPLSKTIGKHVLVCWQRNWKFRTLCQNNVYMHELYSTENIFWLVGNEIELL